MTLLVTVDLPTPLGPLSLVVDAEGAVLASGFGGQRDLTTRLGRPASPTSPDAEVVADVRAAVQRFFSGDVASLDHVVVREPAGSEFSRAVWRELRAITPGEPVTYAELARRAGSPSAARAVGGVCARNVLAPFVPCHRVVPAGGGVGGYAYGADVKSKLLAHERAARAG